MRADNREVILDAARRVVQNNGVTGLKFDAVARESGLTRPGVMYHFPRRELLVLATHRYLAGLFEERLRGELGMPFEESSADDRLLAYVRACAGVTSRAELLFMLDGALDPEASTVWSELNGRWVPPSAQLHDGPAGMLRFIIRIASDGLWLYEASTGEPLTESERREVAEALAGMLGSGSTTAGAAPAPDPAR
ncbi:TetR/AcrR family transcriptional regulator [Dietzia lutea]|uniref:HTH tetR-type domain-containing protein n=1 Tax=Dietzia lutea TaxID=546160 RepID=A0A2S1R3V3_9ACTN|nr:TetR/AcrR family transcriptional regulator [Dietzia lutea]AWH90922.1 hypothetical protein A6035_00585 [Dietzia lutea]